MITCKLHGVDTAIAELTNGNVLVTGLSASTNVTLNCLGINFGFDKKSEVTEIAGAVLVDAKIYKDTFNIVTEYTILENFGTYLSNLASVLHKNYLYIQVIDYPFEPFDPLQAMPFEVMSFAVSDSRKGYKNITLELEKRNGKS